MPLTVRNLEKNAVDVAREYKKRRKLITYLGGKSLEHSFQLGWLYALRWMTEPKK